MFIRNFTISNVASKKAKLLTSACFVTSISVWFSNGKIAFCLVLYSFVELPISKMFPEVCAYSHRLRTLFVAGEHCDYDTLMWARRIFDVSSIHLLS
jgi:hypothetical protein